MEQQASYKLTCPNCKKVIKRVDQHKAAEYLPYKYYCAFTSIPRK